MRRRRAAARRWLRLGSGLLAIGIVLAAAGQPRAEKTAEPARSIWDGVFTEGQAKRGERVYTGPCSRCHGYRLDGAPDDPDMYPTPPIGGRKFLRNWRGRSLGALFDYTRATMPENNPGYLTDEEFTEVIAYMLEMSGVPAGDELLPSDRDRLADIVIGFAAETE